MPDVIKDYGGLEGVALIPLKRHIDDRGYFMEAARKDWSEVFGKEWPVQINVSMSYPRVVRAWHRHNRGQVDYFLVLSGALKICAYKGDSGAMAEVVTSAEVPTIVRIPGHYWHGTMAVGDARAMVMYMVTRLYDYRKPDEERRAWNDPDIIPRSINGRTDDPRVGKPWDWYAPSNR